MSLSPKTIPVYWYLDGVSSRDLSIVILSPSGKVMDKITVPQGSRTEKLLPALAGLLKAGKYELRGIMVAQGASSFSQTRLLTTTANALAYAQRIKLASVKIIPPDELGFSLPKLVWQRSIKPAYRGPGVG